MLYCRSCLVHFSWIVLNDCIAIVWMQAHQRTRSLFLDRVPHRAATELVEDFKPGGARVHFS
jgi:hypothetical protein